MNVTVGVLTDIVLGIAAVGVAFVALRNLRGDGKSKAAEDAPAEDGPAAPISAAPEPLK